MEQLIGSKSGKEYDKAVYCHPAYLTSMQSTSWEAQAEIKIAGRNINMQMTPHLQQKAKKNKPLDESERRMKKLT